MPNTSHSDAQDERTHLQQLTTSYRRFIIPTENDLPRWRVVLIFPALLLIVGIALVGFAINGSSSGAYYSSFYQGKDPSLLLGHPEAIRSDEWNVGTVWTIGQVQQGLPVTNETFPGGMDAALPYDLPRFDPSVAFRPHLLGYLFLDINNATAWRWWIPGLALIAAAYFFVVAILPRRPIVAAVLSVGFFYSPFFQWWYQASTLWPAVWALATMAALVWAVKTSSALTRWVGAAIVSYLTVVMAMGIYAPFIIPAVIVVGLFGIGLVIEHWRQGTPFGRVLFRVLPVLAGGVVAGAVTVTWLVSKARTVNAFLDTVYPGQRLTATGQGGPLSIARTISSSFSESLKNSGGFLGINSSEASTFFLIGAFLVPVFAWSIVRAVRGRLATSWSGVGIVLAMAIFLAFMLIPGWDPVAHLLFLDRSTADRTRIGLGIASFALLPLILRQFEDLDGRAHRGLAYATAGIYALSQVAIAAAVTIVSGPARLWGAAPYWWAATLLGAAAMVLFARRRLVVGASLFLVVTVFSSITVNPVYVGVFDMRKTSASHSILAIDKEQPGKDWVGVGGQLVTALLIESGVHAFNGTQGAPSRVMWAQIDPQHKYAQEWNRIGRVFWVPGAGAPVVTNPAPDQIQVTFDACSPFAQKHVGKVLTDTALPSSQCLKKIESISTAGSQLTAYQVIPSD